jgi:PAS domain S-box-containing protein
MTAATQSIGKCTEAEAHIAQIDRHYRDLLEAAPDAIVVVNLQAEKQFGYRRDELLGQQIKNIIPEGFAPGLQAVGVGCAADALTQQTGTGIKLQGKRKDRSKIAIEAMFSPVKSVEASI